MRLTRGRGTGSGPPRRPLSLIAAVLAAACAASLCAGPLPNDRQANPVGGLRAASASNRFTRDDALQEIDRLEVQLRAARPDQARDQWHADARRLFENLESLPFPQGGSAAVRDVEHFQPMLDPLREWAGTDAALPAPLQYRKWSESLKTTLAGGRRLEVAPPNGRDIAEAKIRLGRILAQRPYKEVLQSEPSLMERLAEVVYRYVIRPLFGERGHSIRNWVIAGCLLVLGLVIAHAVWEVWLIYGGGRRRAGMDAGAIRLGGYVLSISSGEDVLKQADGARAGGNLVRAVGLYYLALIAWLSEAGCTRLDRTLTNWEHYQLAQASGRLEPEKLRRLADLNAFFDDHCYGGQVLSEDAVAEFRRSILNLRSAL